MNLSHFITPVAENISANKHLNDEDVHDYTNTVKCYKEFEPTIAIVKVDNNERGLF